MAENGAEARTGGSCCCEQCRPMPGRNGAERSTWCRARDRGMDDPARRFSGLCARGGRQSIPHCRPPGPGSGRRLLRPADRERKGALGSVISDGVSHCGMPESRTSRAVSGTNAGRSWLSRIDTYAETGSYRSGASLGFSVRTCSTFHRRSEFTCFIHSSSVPVRSRRS